MYNMDKTRSLRFSPSRYEYRHAWCEVKQLMQRVPYNLYTIWLFTFSDLKTIVIPSTAFAIIHRLRDVHFDNSVQVQDFLLGFVQVAIVAGWTWVNLLPFAIDNQRQRHGIEEDKLNKPWRPLPSGRITAQQATTIMSVMYPLAIIISVYLGSYKQSLALLFLGVWYNDLGGADASWLVRNLINGCGYICYASGAFQVILGKSESISPTLQSWFIMIGCIVFTTVQIQDLYDQVGDSQRGRRTAPLVLGDYQSRWTIALPVLLWSWYCPQFWSLPVIGSLVPVLLGLTITYRLFNYRDVEPDKVTFRIWNLWLVSLYSLPLIQSLLLQRAGAAVQYL